MLDMYACVEHSPIVEEPTDSEFDVRVSQNSLNLNIDSSRMAMEQQFDEIVNNNEDVQGELDSDEPSQYESSDDDQSFDDEDDDNNDKNINGESTPVSVYTGNHSSIAIPYLDHTEESPEELSVAIVQSRNCNGSHALVDRFIERDKLVTALLEKKARFLLGVEDKIQEYWKRSQSRTDMMTYQTSDGVFEILTFAKNSKCENVHKVSAKGKKCSCGKWRNLHMSCSHAIEFCGICGIAPKDYVSKYYSTKYYKRTYSETFTPVGQQAYWPPAQFRLIANIEYLRTSSVDSRTRLKNDMNIALDRMARKCSICKQTGHIKARCPRRN
ncbi:putative receptor-like protein 12-like [Capsicum annuum]|nr:putative receptor-like protein 12-like [Capsicum annuum]